MVTIEYLSDYPEHVGSVALWLYYRDEPDPNLEDPDYVNLYTHFHINSKTKLPIRLVAISDGKCVGTVTMIGNDFPGKSYTPWLGGLHVDIPYRNRGIGRQLIDFVKQTAKDLGYTELYLGTDNAGQYYRKLGWKCIEAVHDSPYETNQTSEIYKYDL